MFLLIEFINETFAPQFIFLIQKLHSSQKKWSEAEICIPLAVAGEYRQKLNLVSKAHQIIQRGIVCEKEQFKMIFLSVKTYRVRQQAEQYH